MRKLLLLLAFSAIGAFAQCGPYANLLPIGGGRFSCVPSTTFAAQFKPYYANFSGVATLSVTAATHGQGTQPFGACWDNASPANLIPQTANYPTVSSTGTIVFAWTGNKTGYCIISALGQGATGPSGPTVYPAAGIAVSSGSSGPWGTSLTAPTGNLVGTGQANTFTTGLQDFSAASWKIPTSAGFTATASSMFGYDSTAGVPHVWAGADKAFGTAAYSNTGTSGATVPILNVANTWGATQIMTHLTVEGVTSAGATGTGKFVFSDTPTFTGHPTIEGVTSTGATGTANLVFSAAPTLTGHPTIEGVTSTGATGTGNFVFSASPTFTGTVTMPAPTLNNVTGSTQCLHVNSSGVVSGSGSDCGSGTGGVTSFSGDGSLISNTTSTGAVTAALANAAAHSFWGNNTGSTGAPGYHQPAFTDISGTAAAAQLPLATTLAFGAVKPDGTTITISSGVITAVTGGSGTVSTTGSPASTYLTVFSGAATITGASNATLNTSTGALAVQSVATGSSPPSITPGTGGAYGFAEGTAPSVGAASGVDLFYADSTQHGFLASFNNGSYLPLVQGPATSTTGHLALWNSGNGGLLQDGGAIPSCTNDGAHALTYPSGSLSCTPITGGGGGSAAVLTSVAFNSTPTFVVAANSTPQVFSFGALTGNVTASTLTTSSATAGEMVAFIVPQDVTGGRQFAWPSNVTNPVTVSPTASGKTIQYGVWDGSNVVGNFAVTTDTFVSFPTAAAPATPASGSISYWHDSTDLDAEWKNASGSVFKGFLTGADCNPVTGVCTKTNGTSFSGLATLAGVAAGDIAYYNGSSWVRLAGNASGTNYLQENASGVPSWAAGSSSIAWNSISNATGNLSLSNGTNTTTFNHTSGVAWLWANTTAATSGASQSSPIWELEGTEWHSAASTPGGATIQFVPGTGTDAASTLTISHAGTATGTMTTSFPGPISAAGDGVHPGVDQFVGNTTAPSLPSNTFSLIGPNAATFTAYGLQFPTTNPAANQVLAVGAPSSGVAQISYISNALTINGAAIALGASGNANWVTGAITTLHVAQFTGTSGELQDGGVLGTAAAAATASACSGQLSLGWTSGSNNCSATPTLGASGTLGSVTMGNATSGLLTLEPATGAITSYTLQFPVAQPTSGNTFISCTAANPSVCTFTAGGGGSITGSGLTAYDVYYVSSSGLALAEANASSTTPAVCVASSNTVCITNGTVTNGSWTWTAGQILYLSDSSSGALTSTEPSTSGHYVQRVAVALSATQILVMPSLDVGGIQ